MPDGLYETDILIWSEQQADLLRRMAAGERLNEQVDWVNLIEEVECVGRSEFNACRSLLLQALIHLIKLHLEPGSRDAAHWLNETTVFLDSALAHFTLSMSTRLDTARLFQKASRATGLPRRDCPYTLDDLLAEDPDIHALVARLDEPA